jgi:hypothetical protein
MDCNTEVPTADPVCLHCIVANSLATFTGDLSSMTAPSFILSPTSLVEFSACESSVFITRVFVSAVRPSASADCLSYLSLFFTHIIYY